MENVGALGRNAGRTPVRAEVVVLLVVHVAEESRRVVHGGVVDGADAGGVLELAHVLAEVVGAIREVSMANHQAHDMIRLTKRQCARRRKC